MGEDEIDVRQGTTSGAPMPGKPRTRITVVVADDHPLYRDGLVRALLACGQVEIVAEAPDGRVALAAIQEHQPDVPHLLGDLRRRGLPNLGLLNPRWWLAGTRCDLTGCIDGDDHPLARALQDR